MEHCEPQCDEIVKSSAFVSPGKTGVQNMLKMLDSGLRRYDEKVDFLTFYETVKCGFRIVGAP